MKKIILLAFAFMSIASATNCADTETQSKDAKRILGWKSHAALGCAKTLAFLMALAIADHRTRDITGDAMREDTNFNWIILGQIGCIAMVVHSIYQSFRKSHKLYTRTH